MVLDRLAGGALDRWPVDENALLQRRTEGGNGDGSKRSLAALEKNIMVRIAERMRIEREGGEP